MVEWMHLKLKSYLSPFLFFRIKEILFCFILSFCFWLRSPRNTLLLNFHIKPIDMVLKEKCFYAAAISIRFQVFCGNCDKIPITVQCAIVMVALIVNISNSKLKTAVALYWPIISCFPSLLCIFSVILYGCYTTVVAGLFTSNCRKCSFTTSFLHSSSFHLSIQFRFAHFFHCLQFSISKRIPCEWNGCKRHQYYLQ